MNIDLQKSYLTALVHPENQLNTFLAYSGVDAWRVIEVQPSQPNGKSL